jgi:hypothetical protein
MDPATLNNLRTQFKGVLDALRSRAAELAAMPSLVAARPGYVTLTVPPTPALVLAFAPRETLPDAAPLTAKFGVTVRTTYASPAEQLRGAGRPTFTSPLRTLLEPTEAPGFAPPERGTYVPPAGPDAPKLTTIAGKMKITLCASPDAGWPVLRDFFAEGVETRLTVAMYDFTAHHVEKALLDAMKGTGATLRMVLDGKPASGGVGGNGVNGPDSLEADVMKRLGKALKLRFKLACASVGAGAAVPNAYHIKVASADGRRLWLSSGNWQSSNLAPWDYQHPVHGEPPLSLGRYNRDYHVVVENEQLAETYAAFIEYDATLGGDYAAAEPDAEPFLLVPDETDEVPGFAAKKRFKPLELDEQIEITPLLTPDNFPTVVNDVLSKAKHRVWVQNQYIQPKPDGDNFPEFDRLMELLGELASKVDLRLCLRGIADEDRDRLLAAGVQPSQLRRQSNCHAKLIVVDDDIVIVGSQNLSNVGFVANRDASLKFENAKVTRYFADIFEEDWNRASPIADGDSFGIRVATDDAVPAGYTRVPWSDVFDTRPPSPPPFTGVATTTPPTPTHAALPPSPSAATGTDEIPLFGVDVNGKRGTEKLGATAAAVRAGHGGVDDERKRLGVMAATPSFGVTPGASVEDLSEVGWGVVWAPGTPQAVKDALKPLLDRRSAEVANPLLFHEFQYVAGETPRQFLQRNGANFGSVVPQSVPYYLLLVGPPDQIPFTFQSLIDVEYRVGRLDLPTPEAFATYAKSVVAVETRAAAARDRVLHTFGPAHAGDAPTALSVDVLVRAATKWLDEYPKPKQEFNLSAMVDAAEAATKARLVEILRGIHGRPELLFTAGHGMMVASGSVRQPGEQGALVTADWDGFGGVDEMSRFAAADLPADADVCGLVAFLFACYGAGTPATDSFPTKAGQPLAPKAFVSALPQALLAHPKGGALGVFGHVDRTLTWSLQPPQSPVATDPFARAAIYVLRGSRLGAALDDLNQRGATLGADVACALAPGAPPISDLELVRTWTQQRDATAFLLLGDPAARLPR